MQRQSLTSLGRGGILSKDDAVSKPDDLKQRDLLPSFSSVDDDEIKPEKPLPCNSRSEKFIHLTPVLILLCFFILYLSSHDPSPIDLAQFNVFNHPNKIIYSIDIDDNGDGKLRGNDMFATRSLRNLQEDIHEETPKPRSHRKLGDF